MTCDCQSNVLSIAGVHVGKLERGNPLPPGSYWLDVIDTQNQTDFGAFTLENSGKIKVLKTEHFDAVRWPDCPITEGQCSPSRDWVKFEVTAPIVWNSIKFGFPNVIEQGETVESSADTATEPDFGENCDIGCQAEKVAIAGGVILGGVALILVIKAMSK